MDDPTERPGAEPPIEEPEKQADVDRRMIHSLEDRVDVDRQTIRGLEDRVEVDRRTIRSLEDRADVDRAVIAQLVAEGEIDREEIANLKKALETARHIGAAMGVLMASRKVTDAQAFDLLRQGSQSSNRKLRDVADDVVLTGTLPKT